MGCGDTANDDVDSVDLYSRVKLRSSTRKPRAVANDFLVAKDEKLVNDGLKKSRAYYGKRRFSVNLKNSAWTNDVAMENSKSTSVIAVTDKETETWKNDYQDLSNQCANAHAEIQLDLLLDEGTAVEMLASLGKGRANEYSNHRFDFGDMVWGKIQSYPWWPGQIFDQALASSSVCSTKREGSVLVAFYGDYTYGWLRAQELIPFEKHYAEKSKQTDAKLFLTAVKEAKKEFERRAVLGLACHCRNLSTFLPTNMRGYFEVDVSGYSPGVIYSAKQIERAREAFRPDETLSFLKQLAASPRNIMPQNLSWMKNFIKALAYQRARMDRFDETYCEVFETQQRSSEAPTGMDNTLQAPSGSLLVAEAKKKGILSQVTRANYLQNDDILVPKCEVNDSWGWFSGEASGDHEMQSTTLRSIFSGSEGTCYVPPQKQLKPRGTPDSGNISGSQENLSMKKKVRLNRIKSLARIAGNQKHLELQGGEIIATSSIKLEKNSEMETNNLVNYAEPSMMVIEFPYKEIPPQTSLNSGEFFSDLKPKFQQLSLLPENIQMDCQEESNYFLSSAKHHSEISQHLPALSPPPVFPLYSTMPCMNEDFGISHFLESIDKNPFQVEAMKNADHQATTSANCTDVSNRLINLLTSCCEILSELKHSCDSIS
ncbi:hypothetical protein ACH5RR_033458 [Cinchona calisaya]|uniref:PWWP domain-containing protein n=1 Tax=Cinchona calisaya TaxID=153742 RepID=A0ABD2YN29_9GENT